MPQHFPRPGWVEHDPEEIWASVLAAAEQALEATSPQELQAIGITNQRETTVLWGRDSGRPVHHAIVWQDRRTAERCRELPEARLRELTGLVADPYFSATKLEWLLANVEAADEPLAFGTVDSWLVWKLTGGRVHVTDETNASRTLLVSLATLDWDEELLDLFGIPRELLPEIRPSSGIVGEAELFGATIPIAGIAGDQQAALFAAGGSAKATYGTGSFVLAPTGADCSLPPAGLVRTAAARRAGEPPGYALEGSVFVTGAAVQWLRDGLGLVGRREGERRCGRLAREQRRRLLRPGAGRPRLPALGARRARPDHRPDARHDARAPRPRRARGRCLPDPRRARRDARRARACCAPTAG